MEAADGEPIEVRFDGAEAEIGAVIGAILFEGVAYAEPIEAAANVEPMRDGNGDFRAEAIETEFDADSKACPTAAGGSLGRWGWIGKQGRRECDAGIDGGRSGWNVWIG